MDQISIIRKTETYVRETLAGEATGHDWWHIARVRDSALRIGGIEKVNLYVVELAALLHDIGDWKFCEGDDSVGPKKAKDWLESILADASVIAHVCTIIKEISFKGAGELTRMSTREGMVVQDADRLDAIGAVGIARAFAYGGFRGREIHNPGRHPEHHETFDQYKNSTGPTINHFYEKLLLLRDRMNTPAAKRIADERHAFMEAYLLRFFREWNGEL